MLKSSFAILLGGEITVTSRLNQQLAGRKVIAADSGIEHAISLGLKVDLWVGDFDSASPDTVSKYKDVPRQKWNPDKDQTDGEIAIAAAYDQGADDIILVGAMGGRTDHATNHLLKALSMPGSVLLTSGREEAIPLKSQVGPDWPAGTTFSVLAFDELCGLTINGAKWPLDAVQVPSGSGWTISNVVENELTVSVDEGRAMLIGNLQT